MRGDQTDITTYLSHEFYKVVKRDETHLIQIIIIQFTLTLLFISYYDELEIFVFEYLLLALMVNTHYLYEYVMSSLNVLIVITISNDAFSIQLFLL
jgi:hypothetical protein